MAEQALERDGLSAAGAGTGAGAAAPAVPCDLPPSDPCFLGRAVETRELLAEIDRPGLGASRGRPQEGCRVLLVAGRAGSGRTALAVHLARLVADRYPDGQLFARLTRPGGAPVSAAQAARSFLERLGRPDDARGPEPAAALRRALAGRRVLIVLDDVDGAAQIRPLLPDAPGSLVVATSAGPLTGIPDVRPCALGGLDTASAVELLTRTAGSTRVTCDPCAAESLVAECAGHPAALLLAGAWLAARPRMSVTDALQHLRDVPDTPFPPPPPGRALPSEQEGHPGEEAAGPDGGGAPPVPAAAPVPPSPLLRAFRLVYESFAPGAARMLRLLVLAPEGVVDEHVASALGGCSVAAARSTLDELVRAGVLVAEGDALRVPACLVPALRALTEALDRPAEVELARARMLERTVRLLHACRLALTPPDAAVRARIEALPRAMRFRSRAAAADWLDGRLPSLLAAADAAAADGGFDTLAQRLVAGLVRALTHTDGDRSPELYRLHGLVLEVATRRGLHRERAAALINLADLDVRAGRPEEALGRYREAVTAARADGDGAAAARALEAIGSTYRLLDDPDRAADWYGRALALRQFRGEQADQARLHGHLGAMGARSGRWTESLREWRACAALHRRLGNLSSHARALGEAAGVLESAGEAEEGLRVCREALQRARTAGDTRLEAALQLRMGDTLERLGDAAGARLHRAEADRLLENGNR
ncbi:tetratricopeptide repeat protein [Streptomyces sp. NPDC059637]|uniref:tetratricopeptide repeat protein n=1 Tax=Streptomyces sp. NPDC059637 TaxID=3347752 RepID=UPI0036A847BC